MAGKSVEGKLGFKLAGDAVSSRLVVGECAIDVIHHNILVAHDAEINATVS